VNGHTSRVAGREPHLNAANGALWQLLAAGGWHREAAILDALWNEPSVRVLQALDHGVRCGLYRQWNFRGEGCWSDELHYSLVLSFREDALPIPDGPS
jgi:hypothetical protein